MSDTPRTDAEFESTNRRIELIGCGADGGLGPVDAVTAEFARRLERDLTELQARVAEYESYVELVPPDDSEWDFLHKQLRIVMAIVDRLETKYGAKP